MTALFKQASLGNSPSNLCSVLNCVVELCVVELYLVKLVMFTTGANHRSTKWEGSGRESHPGQVRQHSLPDVVQSVIPRLFRELATRGASSVSDDECVG